MTSDPPLPSCTAMIVNYRSAGLTTDCLQSLADDDIAGWPDFRAIVVDNDSRDGSVEAITDAIAANGWHWARVVASPTNGGFAYGNNQAYRAMAMGGPPSDLVWLLNPDTRVEPGAARTLAQFMQHHPAAGIAGSAILQEDGSAWRFAFRFPTLLGEIERGARLSVVSRLLSAHAVPRPMGTAPALAEWVSGASMMVRRGTFEAVGPMDEAYFLYYEETDFCLQARRAGWECWYVPQAVVTHLAGKSTGLTDPNRRIARMPRYWFESRRRYFIKNHGRAYTILADMLWAASHVGWRIRRWVQRLPDPDPPALLRDFLWQSALFRGLPADRVAAS